MKLGRNRAEEEVQEFDSLSVTPADFSQFLRKYYIDILMKIIRHIYSDNIYQCI